VVVVYKQVNRKRCNVNGLELFVSSSFRRSVRLGEIILAHGTKTRCPLPLTRGVRLLEVSRDRSLVSDYERCLLTGGLRKRRFDCDSVIFFFLLL